MDLPTYTSIWRIEKRLYKLYDFRLPMPLPIGQVTVFAAITVPYVVLLTMLGLPFNHTLIWLYILPPGVATWLATRPVLESKRLPELIRSQLRYLAEPRVLCRMAPLAERDVVFVSARIWRPRSGSPPRSEKEATASPAAAASGPQARMQRESLPAGRGRSPAGPGEARAARPVAVPEWAVAGPLAGRPVQLPPASAAPPLRTEGDGVRGRAAGPPLMAEIRIVASVRPAPAAPPIAPADPEAAVPELQPESDDEPEDAAVESEPAVAESEPEPVAECEPAVVEIAAEPEVESESAPAPAAAEQAKGALPTAEDSEGAVRVGPPRPMVSVVNAGSGRKTPPTVERALAGPDARRGDGRPVRVSVVPGGHRPGKPDLLQRDRTRAQLPIDRRARILVLGCTVGAGQTMTALMVGEVLASLRSDQVAALDLNPGPGGLTKRAEARPALSHAGLTGQSRLAILGPQQAPAEPTTGGPRDPGADVLTFEAASDSHDIAVADPAAVAVPRLLALADQLVLVAPASAAASNAIVMTFEWLEAHGQAELAKASIMTLNGVSRRTAHFVEQADRVCSGRCRAIVRVPWDDQLQSKMAKQNHATIAGSQASQHWTGVLSPQTAAAYTALAGVLVAGLAEDRPDPEPTVRAGKTPAHAGRSQR